MSDTNLDEDLKTVDIDRLFYEYYGYPEVLRLKAEIEQLKERLSRIAKIGQTGITDFLNQSAEITAIKREIFNETDIIGINLTEALEFCRKSLFAYMKEKQNETASNR